MSQNWKNKAVFITGVCGTIGQEVLQQLVSYDVKRIVGIDNNESELFFLDQKHREDSRVKLFLGDLRDYDSLKKQTENIDIVVHCAALKHVILCEESPRQAVLTNISGTQNVIDAAFENNVERVIFTSSDKAVNPTNVMGTSKLMGERLMTAANAMKCGEGPIFSCTRFGNVLGSRGSVIPIFMNQIQKGGPVTLTDLEMSRFIMSIEEAVSLVLESVFLSRGGEIFVTKMPVLKIEDLAHVLINECAEKEGYKISDIEIKTIGSKSGEKLYEELLNEEEIRRTVELEKYFVITPAFKSVYETIDYNFTDQIGTAQRVYNSSVEAKMSHEEIKIFLNNSNLL